MLKSEPGLKDDARIGIVNRGEAAIRFIRAVRDFNQLCGTKMQTVAFYTDRERDALFVQQADEAHAFSYFPGCAGSTGSPYLNRDLVMEALLASNCSALWPGWGFLSEDAGFAALVEKAGLVFLGPSSAAMSLLGDKIGAKELAEKNDVPVCPWSGGPVKDIASAREIAREIGYPVIIKAANAGGGRGIRFVPASGDLDAAWKSAVDETLRITGNSVVFIERLVEKGRHMEVQVLADRFGNVKTFGVRDCSVQRKNQKIVEETPAPDFDSKVSQAMEAAASRLIRAAGYQSAGTVEFLYDLGGLGRVGRSGGGEFYFMEVNTRLQVEHTVTEQLYGVDLVHGQIRVARGEDISALNPLPRGAVIEARLNAEDPNQDFRPAPGKVLRFRIPSGPGIRVDSGIEEGSEISPDFDSMVAKIIACGPDRPSAIARLERALQEMRIKIGGGTTNRSFVLGLLSNPDIRRGGVHTRFVEELLSSPHGVSRNSFWPQALICAAIERYHRGYSEDFANFSQQMFTFGSPRNLRSGTGHEVQMNALGQPFSFLVRYVGENWYSLRLKGDEDFSVRYVRTQGEAYLFAGGKRRHVQISERGDSLQVEIDGIPYEFETESGGMIKSPSPALVLSVPLSPGAVVERGDVLLTLEAMKMEMIVPSPQAGLVREIRVKAGEQVGAGQVLVVLDGGEKTEIPGNGNSGRNARVEVSFEDFRDSGNRNEWERLRREVLAVFAGFDSSPAASGLFEDIIDFVKANPDFNTAFRLLIQNTLEFFAAIQSLFAMGRTGSPGAEVERISSSQELLSHYFKRSVDREKGLPESFVEALSRVFALYRPGESGSVEDTRHLIFNIFRSQADSALKQKLLLAALSLTGIWQDHQNEDAAGNAAGLLDEIVLLVQARMPALADAAINARYRVFDRRRLESIEKQKRAQLKRLVDLVVKARANRRGDQPFFDRIQNLGNSAAPEFVNLCLNRKEKKTAETALEGLCRRMNRDRDCLEVKIIGKGGARLCRLESRGPDGDYETLLTVADEKSFDECLALIEDCLALIAENSGKKKSGDKEIITREIIIYVKTGAKTDVKDGGKAGGGRNFREDCVAGIKKLPPRAAYISLGFLEGTDLSWQSFIPKKTARAVSWAAEEGRASLSPLSYRELRIYRLSRFKTELLQAGEDFYIFYCVSTENERDERLMVFAEVSSTRAEMAPTGAIGRMVAFEKTFMDAVYALRAEQIRRRNRLHWNRIVIHIRPVLDASMNQIQDYASLLASRTPGLGIERLSIYCRIPNAETGKAEEQELLFDNIVGTRFTLSSRTPVCAPMEPMDAYVAKVVRSRQRNTFYPYEVIRMLTEEGDEDLPPGGFEEYDLSENPENPESPGNPANSANPGNSGNPDNSSGTLPEKTYCSVRGRPYGQNKGNIVFGLISNRLPGPGDRILRRVIIISDPVADFGSLTETECRRVNAALDLAEDLGIPAEFLPISGGARIDMDSGTENLDWTASTLRRIIEYTQRGKELNIIVAGINVGAQSYWDAEASMLMHTRGLLIMTEDASLLLTGKTALDFSGSVSAEDNVGIGGVAKIMEPNGQAQIRVKNLKEAWMVLFRHYSLSYREPGALYPPRAPTQDPQDRDISVFPYKDNLGQGFTSVGDIFSPKLNPERKKPFDIRQVMLSLIDQDMPRLERWGAMRDAETAVVWEARIAGYAAGIIGIESRPVPRQGDIPWDGPENWSGGTLFPLSSKKVARGINAFSGRLPLVMLANLSGFDGSPESLRKLQLEYGAEIGRAVVNFRGPFIFVVIARYHGGAYVVFSKRLNARLHSVALEGAYASVIGGAPAAAVVFPSLVLKETYQDSQLIEAQEKLKSDPDFSQKDFEEIFHRVHTEKQTALAARFDSIHTVERAKKAGSIDAIITVKNLRPYIVQKIAEQTHT